MNIVFKKDSIKKYVCSICGIQFKWSNASCWFGTHDESPEVIICSEKCKTKFKAENGIK